MRLGWASVAVAMGSWSSSFAAASPRNGSSLAQTVPARRGGLSRPGEPTMTGHTPSPRVHTTRRGRHRFDGSVLHGAPRTRAGPAVVRGECLCVVRYKASTLRHCTAEIVVELLRTDAVLGFCALGVKPRVASSHRDGPSNTDPVFRSGRPPCRGARFATWFRAPAAAAAPTRVVRDPPRGDAHPPATAGPIESPSTTLCRQGSAAPTPARTPRRPPVRSQTTSAGRPALLRGRPAATRAAAGSRRRPLACGRGRPAARR